MRKVRKAYGAPVAEAQNYLRQHRNALNWTLDDVAEKLNVTGETVRKWETTGELSVKQLLQLAAIFQVPPYELIPGGPDYTEEEIEFINWLRSTSAHDRRSIFALAHGLQEKEAATFELRKEVKR